MPEETAKTFHNIDELLKQMELDELADAPLVTPVQYAKTHPGLSPQIVYYHIRAKHLRTTKCPCGRTCIFREEADKFFDKKKGPNIR